jgi:hypothetical protein
LALSITEPTNTEEWLKSFHKEAATYHKEIEAIIPERIKSKNSFIQNLAQLQREKIAASKMQLRRLL